MYTLALDTTGYKIHLVLLKNDLVVYERDWRSNMNEDETITKTIQHLNEIEPFFAQKLMKIIINEGPGTLTGTRVGVAIANALAYATRATLVKLTSQKLWPMRLREEDKGQSPHLLLRITEQELYVDGEIMPLKDAVKMITKHAGRGKKKTSYLAYGELTPTQFTELNRIKGFSWIIETDLLSFAAALQGVQEKGDTKPASPRYAKPPVITQSKKEQLVVKIQLDGLPDFIAPKEKPLESTSEKAPAPAAASEKSVSGSAKKSPKNISKPASSKTTPKVTSKKLKKLAKPAPKRAAKPAKKLTSIKKSSAKPAKPLPKKADKKPAKKVIKKVVAKKKSFSPFKALAKKIKNFRKKR